VIGTLFLHLGNTEHTVPSVVVAMEVLPGRRQNKLQNGDPIQLDDIASLGFFSSNSILLVGNIMLITSHLVAKNSIVVFGALTDSKIRVSHYKKRHV
jgi:hypothetical protein